MQNILKNIFYTTTAKDTAVVLVGTTINIFAGGLFFILAPRILGPADFGIFSTIIATGILAVNIANYGLDTVILRFAKKGSDDFNKVLSFAFKAYIISGILTAIIGVIFSVNISRVLNHPELTGLLQIAFVSSIFLLLNNFYTSALQAKGEFAKASLVGISSNIARIIILVFAAYFFIIGVYFVTVLFFFINIVSVIFGKIFLPLHLEKTNMESMKSYLKYNFWIALAVIVPSIPIDNYLLLKLAGPIQTGIYAAPFKLLTFSYQFGGNFTRVLASRFSSFDTNEKAYSFAKKSTAFVIFFVFGLVLLILLASSVTEIIFGKQYYASISVLQILSLGFIFFFAATIPTSLILYYFGKSRISFLITCAHTASFLVLLLILVPQNKAIGAAWAFTLSELLALILMSTYVFFKFRKV